MMSTFDRWTDRARRSLVLAQECARALNHAEIGTGHMLAGLMAEGGGVAYQALSALGLGAGSVPEALAKRQPAGGEQHPGRLPFSPRGKKVCELAFREALMLGCNYVGTEHVLLGLVREGEGTEANILVALGINPEDARAKVLELLRGYQKAEAATAAASGPLTLGGLLDAVETVDAFLDSHRSPDYLAQPLANDWARVTKVCEEAGEVWKALSKRTGENYRKGVCATEDELLGELGDCVSAAMLGIQHRTKDTAVTWAVVSAAFRKASQRVADFGEVPADG